MFVADGLTYIELHKTGGSHIRRLLDQFVSGQSIGKHNRVSPEQATGHVIGSIRNPWEWYVSLWAFGASGLGAVRSRCLTRVDFDYYHRELPKSMGKNWLTAGEFLASLGHDMVKPVNAWRDSYGDPFDPELFRSWLKLLLDSKRRFDFGEGYAFSPLSEYAGLLTYRYFCLYTTGNSIYRDRSLEDPSRLADFDREHNITRGMIRNESLEDDFIRVLGEAGYSLSADQTESILNRETGKTNVSQRKPAGFYYDDETIDLVAQHEQYLVEKYHYKPPALE